MVVNGIYAKLARLRDVYGCESVEEILDEIIIAWRKRASTASSSCKTRRR
jgi:hypothetical protein